MLVPRAVQWLPVSCFLRDRLRDLRSAGAADAGAKSAVARCELRFLRSVGFSIFRFDRFVDNGRLFRRPSH